MKDAPSFTVRIMGNHSIADPENDNVDVEVSFADGAQYLATFFTLENIKSIMERNRTTGEACCGLYMWSTDMIIVRQLTDAIIRRVVEDLLTLDEFEKVFRKRHE